MLTLFEPQNSFLKVVDVALCGKPWGVENSVPQIANLPAQLIVSLCREGDAARCELSWKLRPESRAIELETEPVVMREFIGNHGLKTSDPV